MKEHKPKTGCGYTTLIPYNDETREFIKILRKGLPDDRKLRVRGTGAREGEDRPQANIALNKCTHVRLYFDGDLLIDNYHQTIQKYVIESTVLRNDVREANERADTARAQTVSINDRLINVLESHDTIESLNDDLINSKELVIKSLQSAKAVINFLIDDCENSL